MKAKVEHDFVRGAFRIWLWEPVGEGRVRQLIVEEGGARWVDLDGAVAEPPAPSLFLPETALDAIVEAMRDVPAGAAGRDALERERAVADRLLTIVEAHAVNGFEGPNATRAGMHLRGVRE
jgi:hypothetical protein